MVRIELQIDLKYHIDPPGADFIFNIHAARTEQQSVSNEQLVLSQPVTPRVSTDPHTNSRLMSVHALPGELTVAYSATVDLHHHFADPADLAEVAIDRLPPEVLTYLYPSRYCQSDRLGQFAEQEFGHLERGYNRVQHIVQWVQRHITFAANTSDSSTSALDTLIDRVGVCRDFSHLMIALCRALNIPARVAAGTNYGTDPALSPPDFHAYVEVFLGGRWYIFDPSGTTIPMAHVRLGTGRDAADVAFATMFGGVTTAAPGVVATAVVDERNGLIAPHHCREALSTDR
ncbi:MAG: transglutaminase family protein [Pseudohongiellaceae bacterium]